MFSSQITLYIIGYYENSFFQLATHLLISVEINPLCRNGLKTMDVQEKYVLTFQKNNRYRECILGGQIELWSDENTPAYHFGGKIAHPMVTGIYKDFRL